jgi:hypothetical protein
MKTLLLIEVRKRGYSGGCISLYTQQCFFRSPALLDQRDQTERWIKPDLSVLVTQLI